MTRYIVDILLVIVIISLNLKVSRLEDQIINIKIWLKVLKIVDVDVMTAKAEEFREMNERENQNKTM